MRDPAPPDPVRGVMLVIAPLTVSVCAATPLFVAVGGVAYVKRELAELDPVMFVTTTLAVPAVPGGVTAVMVEEFTFPERFTV